MRQSQAVALVIGICAASLLGCNSRPHAPELSDEPVYVNDSLGVRFLAPEGWTQHAKADVPAGKLDKERLLVRYERPTSGNSALLELTAADLPVSVDLSAYLTGPAYGADKWRLARPAEPVDVEGVAALRHGLSARVRGEETTREVVVFRRGERVFFFTGLFASKDSSARSQIRAAVQSVLWKD